VLTPFTTDDGKVLMVDRGEVPKEKTLDPATRARPAMFAGEISA